MIERLKMLWNIVIQKLTLNFVSYSNYRKHVQIQLEIKYLTNGCYYAKYERTYGRQLGAIVETNSFKSEHSLQRSCFLPLQIH